MSFYIYSDASATLFQKQYNVIYCVWEPHTHTCIQTDKQGYAHMFEHTYTHTRTHTHLQQHLSHTLLGLHNTLTQTRTQTQTNTHTNSDASATLFSVYIVFGSQIGISNQVLMQCAVVNRWLALFMGFGWYFVGIFFFPFF